jgi:hypothetical protein
VFINQPKEEELAYMKYCTVYVTSTPCRPSGGAHCRTFFIFMDTKVIFIGLGRPPETQGTEKGVERISGGKGKLYLCRK